MYLAVFLPAVGQNRVFLCPCLCLYSERGEVNAILGTFPGPNPFFRPVIFERMMVLSSLQVLGKSVLVRRSASCCKFSKHTTEVQSNSFASGCEVLWHRLLCNVQYNLPALDTIAASARRRPPVLTRLGVKPTFCLTLQVDMITSGSSNRPVLGFH